MFKKGDKVDFICQGKCLEGEVLFTRPSAYHVGEDEVTIDTGTGLLRYYVIRSNDVKLKTPPAPSQLVANAYSPLTVTISPPFITSVEKAVAEGMSQMLMSWPKPKCTCGAEKCGSPGHSSWCDVERGIA
jgi:hypothetical protein